MAVPQSAQGYGNLNLLLPLWGYMIEFFNQIGNSRIQNQNPGLSKKIVKGKEDENRKAKIHSL